MALNGQVQAGVASGVYEVPGPAMAPGYDADTVSFSAGIILSFGATAFRQNCERSYRRAMGKALAGHDVFVSEGRAAMVVHKPCTLEFVPVYGDERWVHSVLAGGSSDGNLVEDGWRVGIIDGVRRQARYDDPPPEGPDQPDPDKNRDSCERAGNPLLIATGAKLQQERDVGASGGTALLHFSRRYLSEADWTDGALGSQWSHNYARRLKPLAGSSDPTTVRLIRPSGNRYTYRQAADGRWAGDPDVRLELTQAAEGWRLAMRDGTVEHYNTTGQLVRLAAPSGATVTLHYTDGRLAEVRDPASGRRLTFAYDEQDRLTGITGPDGTHHYTFDAQDNLAAVIRPDGRTRDYHYEDTRHPHALTGITDAAGHRYATYAYDAEGRAVVSEHAGGAERTALTYHDDGSTTVTNPLGRETTYHFETLHGVRRVTRVEGHPTPSCEGAHQDYTYTPEGWLASRGYWNGTTTTYAYNRRGLETERVEAVGTAQARTTTTVWHPEHRLPVRVTEEGRVTETAYDARGRVLSRTITDTTTGEARTWSYSYGNPPIFSSSQK